MGLFPEYADFLFKKMEQIKKMRAALNDPLGLVFTARNT